MAKVDQSVKTSVTLMSSIVDALDREAEKEGLSRSFFINKVLAQYFKKTGVFNV
jgi:metal-responsive CopG/Arc/MetJ family transcriptional regulator